MSELEKKAFLEIIRSAPRDYYNGLPAISENDLRYIKPVKLTDWGKFKDKEETEISVNQVVIVLKDILYCDEQSLRYLPLESYNGVEKVEIPKMCYACNVREFYDVTTLANLHLTCLANKQIFKLSTENPLTWLSAFCVYGEQFYFQYSQYISSPDEGVLTLRADPADFEEILTPVMKRMQKQPTEQDFRCLCHLILLAGTKTFTSKSEQISTWLENRKRVAYASMGATEVSFEWDITFFTKIVTYLNLMPKLKKQLYMFCMTMRARYPELAAAITLLANSQMAMCGIIQVFLQGEKKVRAMIEPAILEEVENYLNTIDELRERYGSLWIYHKLLYPEDKTLVFTAFPNLCAASRYYVLYLDPRSTLRNFMYSETSVTVPQLQRLCEMDASIFFKKRVITRDLSKYKMATLGIDLSKIDANIL